MSLGLLLGILGAIAALLGVAAIAAGAHILELQVLQLLPQGTAADLAPALHQLLVLEWCALAVVSLVLLAGFGFLVGRYITAPLRGLVQVVNAFAANGERLPLPNLTTAPREIRQMAFAMDSLATHIEEAHKRDVEISRVKSDFISTAAHQLRTPLTGIRWALEALQLEPLTDSQKALVKSATDKSHDLVAIVGTLLDISSIESGKYNYKFAPTNISVMVSELARDFTVLAQKGNVSLFYAKSEEAIPLAKADKERIKWVLNNLIENAVQYTPAGGTVKLTVEAAPGRVLVRVHDTGIGIGDKDRDNIFERFYRAENAIAKENGGNGLGLYIARTIATDHGGDLNFAPNTDGPGTTFVLSLPIAPQDGV